MGTLTNLCIAKNSRISLSGFVLQDGKEKKQELIVVFDIKKGTSSEKPSWTITGTVSLSGTNLESKFQFALDTIVRLGSFIEQEITNTSIDLKIPPALLGNFSNKDLIAFKVFENSVSISSCLPLYCVRQEAPFLRTFASDSKKT
jgi:hypothetical protein